MKKLLFTLLIMANLGLFSIKIVYCQDLGQSVQTEMPERYEIKPITNSRTPIVTRNASTLSKAKTTDLEITDADLSFWPLRPIDGETVHIYAKVHNRSDHPVANVKVAFYDNADGMFFIVVPIDTLTIPAIDSNATIEVQAVWYPVGQAGKNIIVVEVDPRNEIPETNKDNNLARITIELQPHKPYIWKDISANLPHKNILALAIHPFEPKVIYVGTIGGAYSTKNGGQSWSLMYQCTGSANDLVNVLWSGYPPQPMSWTKPMLYLGTTEYTLIPEDRRGQVSFSPDGGTEWKRLSLPTIAISAIESSDINSLQAFIGIENPFYYQDGLYRFSIDSTWLFYDLTPGNDRTLRINCIEIDDQDTNTIYVGTPEGIYLTTDNGKTWSQRLAGLNIAAIVKPGFFRPEFFSPNTIFALTGGTTALDGFYYSQDAGVTWNMLLPEQKCVAIAFSPARPEVCYLAVQDLGILESNFQYRRWKNIGVDLPDKRILSFAADRSVPGLLYVGTETGIFQYGDYAVFVDDPKSTDTAPGQFALRPGYPNPFRSATRIDFELTAGAEIELAIYNTRGEKIRTLAQGWYLSGRHTRQWDGLDENQRPLASGVYFYRLISAGAKNAKSGKLLLLR